MPRTVTSGDDAGDLVQAGGEGAGLQATGHWTLPHYARLLARVTRYQGTEEVDVSAVQRLDTSGVVLLARLLGTARLKALAQSDAVYGSERRALIVSVCEALERIDEVPETPRPGHWLGRLWGARLLEGVGARVAKGGSGSVKLLGFVGLVLASWLSVLFTPSRWRLNALSSQIQNTGLNALPIVALLTFLVGAVVAFLGATVLEAFGASIYTVDLVAYSFMREFGVLLAAILLAGRTASAFTAQIGSMKVNEEIDALRVQGFDPIEWLVLPRVMALLVTLPILTFVGVVSGLVGGGLVAIVSLDVPWSRVITIYGEVNIRHFLVGMVKAPVFAFLIAVIGCLEGFKVSGSAESVGQHTTSSVVQCIFVVILVDAIAALIFMELGW